IGALADMPPDPALVLEHLQSLAQAAASDRQKPGQLALGRQPALRRIAAAGEQLRELLEAVVAPAHLDTNVDIGFISFRAVILTGHDGACKPPCANRQVKPIQELVSIRTAAATGPARACI